MRTGMSLAIVVVTTLSVSDGVRVDLSQDNGRGRDNRGRDERPAYARATPEEQNLRNNTRYIAPDAKTMLGLLLARERLLGTR